MNFWESLVGKVIFYSSEWFSFGIELIVFIWQGVNKRYVELAPAFVAPMPDAPVPRYPDIRHSDRKACPVLQVAFKSSPPLRP